jgi:hypothetical protein
MVPLKERLTVLRGFSVAPVENLPQTNSEFKNFFVGPQKFLKSDLGDVDSKVEQIFLSEISKI